MRRSFFIRLLTIITVLSVFVLSSTNTMAHERRTVASYQLVVGFIVEPPYEGQKNGVDLRVTSNVTGKTEPVLGIEKTLRVEVTHVPSDVSRTFDLRTIFNDPGHYTADLLPTASGWYRMRFFGTIGTTPVNETFNSKSGGGGFNDVQPSADLQFPEKLPEVREIASAVTGAQSDAAQAQSVTTQAQDTASLARILGIAGIVLGGAGLVLGYLAWRGTKHKA